MKKDVLNFDKPAHYMNKTCNFFWQARIVSCSKRNIFIGSVSTQLSGKLSRLKSRHTWKNGHASRLNANGSKAVFTMSFFCFLFLVLYSYWPFPNHKLHDSEILSWDFKRSHSVGNSIWKELAIWASDSQNPLVLCNFHSPRRKLCLSVISVMSHKPHICFLVSYNIRSLGSSPFSRRLVRTDFTVLSSIYHQLFTLLGDFSTFL